MVAVSWIPRYSSAAKVYSRILDRVGTLRQEPNAPLTGVRGGYLIRYAGNIKRTVVTGVTDTKTLPVDIAITSDKIFRKRLMPGSPDQIVRCCN